MQSRGSGGVHNTNVILGVTFVAFSARFGVLYVDKNQLFFLKKFFGVEL